MNVFYPQTTLGLKSIPFNINECMSEDEIDSQSVFFTETHVYSIDSEGTLYYSKRFADGSFNVDDWDYVEYVQAQCELDDYNYIQDTLIEQAQEEGWYYTRAR